MKSNGFNMLLALGILQLVASTTSPQTTASQATFSAKLFSTISQENMKKNVIISPASIQTALALTYMGAEGKTATELKKGLNLGNNDVSKEQVGEQFQNLMSKLRSRGNATFSMANRIYVKDGLQIAPKFNDVAQLYFASTAENVNFVDSVKTAEKINNWVEKQTENKIRDLISSDDIDGSTAAILVNAIYFKASWKNAFNSKTTTKMDFRLSETSTKTVDMMTQRNRFGYAELPDLDANALSLAYIDTNIQMLVLLPNKLDGLGQLELQLREVDLTKLLNKLKVQYGSISLPKFKIEFNISLKPILETLGMRDLFSPAADFSNLFATKESFFVSKVVHKAFIAVNETGTEAAGATGVGIQKKSRPLTSFHFNVDHPFYFALLDDDTVYFAGHVVDI